MQEIFCILSKNDIKTGMFFVERHACDGQFIKMARAMGMKDADKP